MEKCSISPELLRVSDDVRDRMRRCHVVSFSVGDGCPQGQRTRSLPSGALRRTHRKIDAAVVDDCTDAPAVSQLVWRRPGRPGRPKGGGGAPLILYSPVSWLLALRMLSAEDALEPTVSTRSKAGSTLTPSDPSGRRFSSLATAPGRRAKGLRIGIVYHRLDGVGRDWEEGFGSEWACDCGRDSVDDARRATREAFGWTR